jgi:hypothetical protein
MTTPRARRPGFESRQWQGFFFFTNASRPVLGPTHSPIQCVPGSFPGGKAGGSVKLTIHIHLVLMLRMSGAVSPLPIRLHCVVLRKAQGLYLYLAIKIKKRKSKTRESTAEEQCNVHFSHWRSIIPWVSFVVYFKLPQSWPETSFEWNV